MLGINKRQLNFSTEHSTGVVEEDCTSSVMDNVSVCSEQTTSARGMYTNRSSVPRSNSTTDLFDTALPGTGSGIAKKRKSGLGLKHSFSSSSLDVGTMPRNPVPLGPGPLNPRTLGTRSMGSMSPKPMNSRPVSSRPVGPRPMGLRSLGPIPEAHRAKLTPYQQQRRQMRSSFQFPNGESFTPRNRYMSKSSSTLSLTTRTQSMGSGVARPPGSMPSAMPGAMLGPMPRSQSLTSLRPPQVRAKSSLPAPLAHLSASPVNSTGSTVSSSSGSSVGSRATTVTTPERNIKAPFAPSFAPVPASKLSPTPRGPKPASKGPEEKSLKDISDQALEPLDEHNEPFLAELPPESKTETPEPKKSKIGMLFRKLFHNSNSGRILRKRKRNQGDNSATPSGSSSPVMTPPTKTRHRASITAEGSSLSSVDGTGITKDSPELESLTRTGRESSTDSKNDRMASLTPSLEAEEDVLMDTDLVFDSLLLKENSSSSLSCRKQQDLQLKLQALASPEKLQQEPGSSLHEQVSEDGDPNVDYELVKEFSKLGKYIEVPNATPTSKSFPTLPKRSPKRPALTSKDLAKSFYDQDFNNSRLVKRLEDDWETVHFGRAPPGATDESVREKSLRFAQEVYVKETWSPTDYNRSDKQFIKDRRRMIQLESNGFVNAIKLELNEYKRNEMAVHCDSTKFTHFFV